MTPNEQIQAVRQHQQHLIRAVRIALGRYLHHFMKGHVLSVGEGVPWSNTYVAFCLHHDLLPVEKVESITLVDVCAWKGSAMDDVLLRQKYPLVPVLADASHLPFESKVFTLSLLPFIVGHSEEHFGVLLEVVRCTCRDGLIMIADHDLDIPLYKPEFASKLLGSNHTRNIDFTWLKWFANEHDMCEIFRCFNDHAWGIVFRKISTL